MLKENKKINAKDGQRYPIKEMRVVPFVYYAVIFIYIKLDSRETHGLANTSAMFYLCFNILEKLSHKPSNQF